MSAYVTFGGSARTARRQLENAIVCYARALELNPDCARLTIIWDLCFTGKAGAGAGFVLLSTGLGTQA